MRRIIGSEVRALLQSRLATDAELTAFCIDYFPRVQRRFAAGMDRLQKENLLLSMVSPQAVAVRLMQPHVQMPPLAALAVSKSRSLLMRALLLVSLCGAFGFALCRSQPAMPMQMQMQMQMQIEEVDDRSQSGSKQRPATLIETGVRELKTEPSGARVYVADGRYLGLTPLAFTDATPGRVCIKKEGYISLEVDLDRDGSKQSWALEPESAGAAHLKQKEGCHVPTFLLP